MNWNDEPVSPPSRSRLPLLIGMLAVAAAALIFFSVWEPPEADQSPFGPRHPAVLAKTKLTGFELQPLLDSEESVTSDSLQGKVALINFWGPWCGPCGTEFPHLMQLRDEFKTEQAFQFVSVSCLPRPGDEQTIAEDTREFLKANGTQLPIHIDQDFLSRKRMLAEMKIELSNFGYPTTVVIDREGNLRGCWIGYRPGWEVEMASVVKAALTE